ncbi:MAG TPA: hypothetical protein VIO16_08025 [Dehalococcoidia bacterium]
MPTIPGADAGPVAILLSGIAFIALGFIRGDVVPGWLYRAQVARAEKAEALAESAVKNVEQVTATMQTLLDDRPRAEAR